MTAGSSYLCHLVALVTYFFVACEAQRNQNCSMERLRACGSDFIIYSNTTTLPEDANGLREKCELFTSQVACSLKYVDDCLEGTTRGTLLVTLKAAEEDIEAICTEGNDHRRRFFESVGCMNRVGSSLNGCIGTLYIDLNNALHSAPRDKAIPYACCYYGTAIGCAETALSECGSTSPAKGFVVGLWEHVMGEALSLFCGTHTRGSPSCAALESLLDPVVFPEFKSLAEYAITFARLA